MFIKKITLQGFKTYKTAAVIDDLSPNFNVVVGRNGLGKSNFFSAIRFVLSDTYTHMTREERQSLIHEGSGTVMSAYVEIVFDNTDRRFPVQRDEVSIRRTIGLKKDDYSLDGRSTTRPDIMNLLESAGFSRLNPYYIVPQGKITSLTNSKDSERLQLLKEVSGAKLFENKLLESNKEMTNSEFKMQRVIENMEKLEQKLSDLQMELDHLREYQELEKNKKIYEFNILDRELSSLNSRMLTVEEDYEDIMRTTTEHFARLEEREKSCVSLQTEISKVRSEGKVASIEREQAESDHLNLLTLLATKQAHATELERKTSSAAITSTELQNKIGLLQKAIATDTETLELNLIPKSETLKRQEIELQLKLTLLMTKQRSLLSKRSRLHSFSTRSARDEWLKEQISQTTNARQEKMAELKELESSYAKTLENRDQCESLLQNLSEAIDSTTSQDELHRLEQEVQMGRLKVQSLSEEKKLVWRAEIKMKSLRDSAEHELMAASYRLAQRMNRSQASALEAVAEITQRLQLQNSVYGPLIELFTVSDKYKTAVETIAGNSLFHVIVDNDDTALILMKELARSKVGRVTIMPLNRIDVQSASFPDQEHDFIPLIKKIKHEEVVSKAIQQVFGKTIVVTNLHRGAELARAYNLNAITLDGDRVSTRGLLSGGFKEYKQSSLDTYKLKLEKKSEISKYENEMTLRRNQLQQLDIDSQEANRQLNETISMLAERVAEIERKKLEYSKNLNTKFQLQRKLETTISSMNSTKSAIEKLNLSIHEHQLEIDSEFTRQFTTEEEQRLEILASEMEEVEVEYNAVVTELGSLETDIVDHEARVSHNKEQLRSSIELHQKENRELHDQELAQARLAVKNLQDAIEISSSKLDGLRLRDVELTKKLSDLERDLEDQNGKQASLVKQIEKVSKQADKLLASKSLLGQRREEIQEKVRGLGVLPEEAFQKDALAEFTMDMLYAKLNQSINELKRFAHINKRAMEQFSIFAKEREELVARKQELEESKSSIERLIDTLVQQKDSAIQRSFEDVSRSFSEIFELLVPLGRGQVLMRSKDDSTSDVSIDNYVGVSILVSFNSKEDDQQHIEQLSGGQKSLCAIALILAIQKCDPASFYLFDEIDANLDTQYRTAVASLIQKLAANAQFICTSFRPEMLRRADQFYGVSFSDKVSSITPITQDDALSFVETQL